MAHSNLIFTERLTKTIIVLLAALLAASLLAALPNGKPNIVLILVDDYGYGDISHEGNTQVRTPNIDRIAEEGTRLTKFYQSAGACAPTRASLLTGRDYPRTGVWGVHWGRDFIRRDESTLGNLLQGAGYKTGVFGKWHSGKTWAYFGWRRGFDTSVHTRLYNYWDTMVLADNKVIHVDGPMTDVVGDRAVAFIEDNRIQPFFCYIPFQAIHEPFNCPNEKFSKYKQSGYSDHIARLYGMVEVLDDNIGKVLDALDRHGLRDDTLVLFMVDDGYSPGFDLNYQTRRMNDEEKAERLRGFGRRLRGTKATIWEGGQISPMYLRWPGRIPAGADLDILSNVTDIYPTLAEICGAEFPGNQLPLDGVSLWPALTGKASMDPERIIFDATNLYLLEFNFETEGIPRIREFSAHYRNFKYVRQDPFMYGNGSAEVTESLFNLEQDPLETTDISDKHPALMVKLRKATLNWFDGIITSSRAYKEAVYPVGYLSEGGTPINLDSRTAVLGTTERAGPPGFIFNNWTTPGNGLVYDVEVANPGKYRFELVYKKSSRQAGGVFKISCGDKSATAIIGSEATAFSDSVWLKQGKYNLKVELVSTGKADAAIESMDLLVVHAIGNAKKGQLNNVRMAVEKASIGENTLVVKATGPSRDFMEGKFAPTVTVMPGERILLKPLVQQSGNVACVSVYAGFNQIIDRVPLEESIAIDAPNQGRQSINMVIEDKEGNTYTCAVDLVCAY